MSSHVCPCLVSGELLSEAPGWAPAYFTGLAALALRAGRFGQALGRSAEVLEGWRASETPSAVAYDSRSSTTPVYRQGNIGHLRLQLAPEHWSPPQITGRWCVQPGDVVLNKLAPIRAAFVSANAKRHPVDGNTLIVRGLQGPQAAWTAFCLNQPGYQKLLLMESGVLQRVGLRSLAALHMPPAPPQMDRLSAQLRDALDEQAFTAEAFHRVRIEAEEATLPARAVQPPLGNGAFYARETLTNESWLPSATRLRAEQATLSEELGWAAIGDLASSGERTRLATGTIQDARPLRLRDIGDDLFVSLGEDETSDLIPSRTFASPLVPGEVLLSTLGNSLRAAYVDTDVPRNAYPVDGWVRFRFRETPAAWALLLSAPALRAQATGLAVGSARQFVPPAALRTLRVPVPPREVRDRWQRAVERHHAQRRIQDRDWSALLEELAASFDALHQPLTQKHSPAKEILQ